MAPELDEGEDEGQDLARVSTGAWGAGAPDEQQPAVAAPPPRAAPDAAPWARVVIVKADGRREVTWLLGEAPPDLAVVDALARLQLACRRRGDRVLLQEVAKKLDELLDLAALRGEFEWEAEGGEEPVDVEERMDPGDPVP
jgi:hypothetical protein